MVDLLAMALPFFALFFFKHGFPRVEVIEGGRLVLWRVVWDVLPGVVFLRLGGSWWLWGSAGWSFDWEGVLLCGRVGCPGVVWLGGGR